MDNETRRDLWRRKLCFTWQKPWALEHRCTKGKDHYIEVLSNSETEEEDANLEVEAGKDLRAGEEVARRLY